MVQEPRVVVEHLDGGARAFGCRVHLEFACVAGCSLLVRHQGSHAWQSRAEVFMVDGLVLASRSACVILNSLCSDIATWSHFCPITSTCFVRHVFFCTVSWGLSVTVVVVPMVLSGGARATELSVRCMQHLYYSCWLIVQCPCGIVSAVFQGHAVVTTSFLLALSFFFVPYVWLAFLHSGVERVILYGFQPPLTRWCDCLWMVDG